MRVRRQKRNETSKKLNMMKAHRERLKRERIRVNIKYNDNKNKVLPLQQTQKNQISLLWNKEHEILLKNIYRYGLFIRNTPGIK